MLDGCTRGSSASARACRLDLDVVSQPGRRTGDALLAGFTGEAMVMIDGDGSAPGDEIAASLDRDGFEAETPRNMRPAEAGLWAQETPSRERPPVCGEGTLHMVGDGWRILKAVTGEAAVGPRCAPDGPAALRAAPGRRPAVPAMISVVICAYTQKRWNETLAAVESVRGQSFPDKEIIVVVDHNPDLYAALKAELPDLMVVENREERGLSGGKNTGVAMARGDVVAFLDDDAVASPDWLEFLADSYADPQVMGVGGRTRPNWAAPRPSWFPREFDWVVGCAYRGMPETRSPVRNLLGGNASFRREVFGLAGGFQNGIGRIAGKRPLGCEETEFCIRVTQSSPGSVFIFDTRAVIAHLVPAERCRFGYFRSRCYAEGLSKAQITASVGAGDALSCEWRYSTRTLPAGIVRGVADALRGDRSGLGRAGAILAGLAAAAAGYAVGTASWRIRVAARAAAAAAAGAGLGKRGRR